MTQKKRDLTKDLEFMNKVCSKFTFPVFEYWSQEAETQRIRAEKAESKLEKLKPLLEHGFISVKTGIHYDVDWNEDDKTRNDPK